MGIFTAAYESKCGLKLPSVMHLSYDNQDRLAQIEIRNPSTLALVSKQTYAYDEASNVATHIQDGVRTDYTYDPNQQLLTETKRNGELITSPVTYTGVYTYDANGNRTSRTVNGVQEVYTVDQGDKLLSIAVGGSNTREYQYDLEGRRTQKIANGQTTTYNWNADGRLTGMDLPGTSADPSYVYNGIGTRVSRTVNAATTNWKRAGAGVTAAVLNEDAIAFTPGISSRDGSVSTFTHAGLKNTDRQSVGTSLNATRQYDAFGNVLNSIGTWQTAFGYAGNFGYQQTDDNLQLLGHRYYDSETARFISRDPIKDGRNWYGYGGGEGNPLSSADPTGLRDWGIVGGRVANEQTEGSEQWEVIIVSVDYGAAWDLDAGSTSKWGIDIDYAILIDKETGRIIIFKVSNAATLTIHKNGTISGSRVLNGHFGIPAIDVVNPRHRRKDCPGGTMNWRDVIQYGEKAGLIPSFARYPRGIVKD